MWGWLKSLSVVKKGLLVLGGLVVLGSITTATAHPNPTPSNHSNTPSTAVKSFTSQVVTQTESIPFQTVDQDDGSLAKGQTQVAVTGVNGVKTITYKVTYENGVETAREKVSETVTTPPVNQVVDIGTYAEPAQPICPNGTYVNTYGNTVCSPYSAPSAPAGATAQCVDGTYSFSQSRSGTCSHHGGVATWL